MINIININIKLTKKYDSNQYMQIIIFEQNGITKLQQISKVLKLIKNKKMRYCLKRFVLMWQKFYMFVIQPEAIYDIRAQTKGRRDIRVQGHMGSKT